MANLGHNLRPESSFSQDASQLIANSLQNLVQKKLQHQEYRHKEKFLQGLGLRHDIASSLAHRDDKFIGDFLKNLEGLQVGNQNQPQQASGGYQQGLAGLIGQTDQSQASQAQYDNQQQSPGISELVQRAYADHPGLEQQVSPEQLGNMFAQQMQQNQQFANQMQPQQDSGIRWKSKSGGDFDREYKLEKLKESRIARQDKKFSPIINKYAQEAETASEIEDLLYKLQDLNKEIDEWSPTQEGVTGKLYGLTGIDLRDKIGPKGEDFRKTAAQILNKGTSTIKGVATNFKVKNLQDSLPSLAQSREGREEIIKQALKLQKANQVGFNEIERIRSQYDGELPENFNEVLTRAVIDRKKEILSNDNNKRKMYDSLESALEQARKEGKTYVVDSKTGKKYYV